ncbi:MAG TPA: YdeI/OmpD-associated family protein [Anaerolineales bacterium]|jgi:uncharacterized protein YdeI (YjbR/CyaY-like superfamily)
MKPVFFATPSKFRSWLQKNHAKKLELWVGFYKKGSRKASITWPESVDQALCYGWIDGLRKSIDDERYMIRFSPRKPRSIWSAVNIRRARELIAQGRMRPAGRRAMEARADERSALYSYEQRHAADLGPAFEKIFRANKSAWTFFQAQPPSYRKAAIWWVISAKKTETQNSRLAALIEDSRYARRIPMLTPDTGVKRASRS